MACWARVTTVPRAICIALDHGVSEGERLRCWAIRPLAEQIPDPSCAACASGWGARPQPASDTDGLTSPKTILRLPCVWGQEDAEVANWAGTPTGLG